MAHYVVDTPHIKGYVYEYKDFPERMNEIREFFKISSVQEALDDNDFDSVYESAHFRGISAPRLTAVLLSSGIDILPHVENIHVAMFSGLDITSVILPSNIHSISGDAFLDCTALESVEFNDFTGIIGGSAFAGCSKLHTIRLSKDTSQICNSTFAFCDSLQTILFDGPWEEFKMLMKRSSPNTGLRFNIKVVCNDGDHELVDILRTK